MLKVKICGITNLEDALICESNGADLLGFIFYERSKRFINFADAKNIIDKLSFLTLKIGVFVNESAEVINSVLHQLKLNAVQLHGNESPEFIQKIEAHVIKSFRINSLSDFNQIKHFENITPLLDTFSYSEYGGTGKCFNWEIIPEELKEKIFLAGGISINNIDEAFNKIKPLAVDLSSSLETEPGKKDKLKVIEFFQRVNKLRSKYGCYYGH
jgi:phosphoribosylanthranilate isomerase